MNADQLRQWLMKAPRPAKVRVTDSDGQMNDVVCGQTPWTTVADTIETLHPELLQALDAQGGIVRACRPMDVSEDWSSQDDLSFRKPPPRAPAPPQIPIADLDPESKRLVLMAGLLAEAYRHSTDVAFERLSEMLDARTRREESVDRTREAMYRAHVRMLEDQIKEMGKEPVDPPSEGGLLGEMLQSALQGAVMGGGLGGGSGAPANGKAPVQ
jgi:hypothetical protein